MTREERVMPKVIPFKGRSRSVDKNTCIVRKGVCLAE